MDILKVRNTIIEKKKKNPVVGLLNTIEIRKKNSLH